MDNACPVCRRADGTGILFGCDRRKGKWVGCPHRFSFKVSAWSYHNLYPELLKNGSLKHDGGAILHYHAGKRFHFYYYLRLNTIKL